LGLRLGFFRMELLGGGGWTAATEAVVRCCREVRRRVGFTLEFSPVSSPLRFPTLTELGPEAEAEARAICVVSAC
jgi:hypothetical protein